MFIDDKCKFNDQSCWFVHEDNVEDEKDEEDSHLESTEMECEEEKLEEEKSVFQDVIENLEPPIKNSQSGC